MLSSPFLADHKEEASKWSDDLQSAEEIMHHWVTAQTNVSKLTRKDYDQIISTSIHVADNRFYATLLNLLTEPKLRRNC